MEKMKIPFSEFTFSFSRSSGAGGQNVNKVNSKVTLYWKIDESSACSEEIKERFKLKFSSYLLADGQVQIVSQEFRSQKANMDACIGRLHEMLGKASIRPKVRKATKPKRSAVLKRLNEKKKDSEKKRLRKKDF